MSESSVDVEQYRQDGYLLLKGFFSAAEADEIRDDAKAPFLAQMRAHGIIDASDPTESEFEQAMYGYFERDLPGFVNCANQAHYLMSLHRMGTLPRITSLLTQCGLATPVLSKFPTIYFNSRRLAKQEHYWRQRQHQDWRILQSSLDSVVLWVGLVDIDRTLGALEVIPGSHRSGLLQNQVTEGYGVIDEDRVEESDFVGVELEKGDALLFSMFLVHRSGINVSDSIRWSIHYRYGNLAEPTFIERKFPQPFAYKPDETLVTPGFPSPAQLQTVFAPHET